MPEAGGRAAASTAAWTDVAAFARGLTFEALPPEVVAQAQHCLLDLIGVAAAGSRTPVAAIANRHAATELCGARHQARLLFDGRRASRAGAAFAGATTIDSIDAHDGHALTKGHAGVAVLPALLAFMDAGEGAPIDGAQMIVALVLGYEIATRAGIALHATAADYHCSGSWSALACAAVGARLLGFDAARTRHALGIAEYFGPRGQMLRVCATPVMVKDGSGWGAHVGVTAALLAREGFTGAPAISIESEQTHAHWGDLGVLWRIREQYFKAYPVCRWAQPAIEAALTLARTHRLAAEDIGAVRVETFREATVLGAHCRYPVTTDEAQYSLAYPVAAALVFGRVGAQEIDAAQLADARVRRICDIMSLEEDSAFSSAFPAQRWARVRIALRDGSTLVSEPHRARGGPDNPLSGDELREKYRGLAVPVLGAARAGRIEMLVDALPTDAAAVPALLDVLLAN